MTVVLEWKHTLQLYAPMRTSTSTKWRRIFRLPVLGNGKILRISDVHTIKVDRLVRCRPSSTENYFCGVSLESIDEERSASHLR